MSEPARSTEEIRFEIDHLVSGTLYDLETTAGFCSVQSTVIVEYHRQGLIVATLENDEGALFFDDDTVYWLKQIETLRQQAGVNQRGLELICVLVRQVESLKRQLRFHVE